MMLMESVVVELTEWAVNLPCCSRRCCSFCAVADAAAVAVSDGNNSAGAQV